MEESNNTYYFGPYLLNGSEGVLSRDGKPVSLTPKALETLLVLVRNFGHLVEKEELMSQVWPETAVEEANLTQNIFTLRRILGETEGIKYIETVPRRGYRFVASVKEASTSELAHENAPERVQIDFPNNVQARFLAVLPFINVSGNSDMDYLSDGVTESIINSLAQLPALRVMSRSTVFRYKSNELDAQRIGRELRVDAVLVGRVHAQERRLLISAELVDVANGWQLWGESYDRWSTAIFEVQDEIAKQISAALRLRLTGEEERRLTRRYTNSAEAYQAYLHGRYHWGKYTREGLKQAINHFRQAIDLDPNYALAYAGVVDCCLRLATNYIPPAEAMAKPTATRAPELDVPLPASLEMVNIRQEWDRKAAERERKRAIEAKSKYPEPHQWYAAYRFAMSLGEQARTELNGVVALSSAPQDGSSLSEAKSGTGKTPPTVPDPLPLATPTVSEEVQVFCTIAREQIEAGNYAAGCIVLQRWWTFGEWPRLEGLSPQSAADLLFTAGALAGWLASTRQVPRGQKHSAALLNGAIGLFEQLGSKSRSAEGRIELACCYYREGFFDLGRTTLLSALQTLSNDEPELKSLGLIRLASFERHAGRLHDSLARLNEASDCVEFGGPWATGRYHQELGTTLKELAIAETRNEYFQQALEHFQKALHEFEAIGNHRHSAAVENNYGYLLLALKRLYEAEAHLKRARWLFDGLADRLRQGQVEETLAQFYVATERFDLAEAAIMRAVAFLERGGEEPLFAEALTTQGAILCRLGRHREAKRVLDRANRVAESCGDSNGAGRALLIVIEQMCDRLEDDERLELAVRLNRLLASSQKASTIERLRRCLGRIAQAHAAHKVQGEHGTIQGSELSDTSP